MDTSSLVFIGLAAAGGLGTVSWYFIRRVLMRLDTNSLALADFKIDVAKNQASNVQSINGRAKQEDLDAMKQHLSEFEIDCAKNFITQPALMQVMTSLDRTIQQLTQAITHNSQESREGMSALNKRIDDLMQRKA